MMFTMFPSSNSWPTTSSSMENVHVFSHDDPFNCSQSYPPFGSRKFFLDSSSPTTRNAGTQTDDFDERQECCHKITLALLRASIDLELRLDLTVRMNTRGNFWMGCLDTFCALFTACYRPVVLRDF